MSEQRVSPGLINDLRARTKKSLGYCEVCGQSNLLNVREAAKLIGIPHTNLWRFLGGKDPSAGTIEALATWLGVEWSSRRKT